MTAAPLDLPDSVQLALFTLGSLVTAIAAYRTATTGDPTALLLAASGLGTLLVLTTDYEKLEK
ncbi:hypothetical protein NDI56_07375 [Haloarcula sp. S1CR25-12]|uniref:Uncharacterized protein n=1 Tax=Haloarcula saliterrae TaxID=2950534 RepID=A0ABU2FAG1_9EURY|nr:hypothetical protein [Haloarcula sp. S1CR25-12]MDS0259211.1 hypothetical protein [Haloarcula sp. S1CR25-12]